MTDIVERLRIRWEKREGAAARKISAILGEAKEAADEIASLQYRLEEAEGHLARLSATQHNQGGEAFEDLLDQYFDIGVREGREKRDHDDMMRSAELTREKIRAAFNADRKYPAALAQQPQSVQEGWVKAVPFDKNTGKIASWKYQAGDHVRSITCPRWEGKIDGVYWWDGIPPVFGYCVNTVDGKKQCSEDDIELMLDGGRTPTVGGEE